MSALRVEGDSPTAENDIDDEDNVGRDEGGDRERLGSVNGFDCSFGGGVCCCCGPGVSGGA